MLPNESLLDVLSFVDGASVSTVLASNASFYQLVVRNKDKLPFVHRMQVIVRDSLAIFRCEHNCVQQHILDSRTCICKYRKWLWMQQHFDMRVHAVTKIIVRRSEADLWRVFHGIPALTSAHCMEVSADRGGHLQGVFAAFKNLRHLRVNFSSEETWPDFTFLSENGALGVRRLELHFAGGVNEFPLHEFFRFLFDFTRMPVGIKAKKVFVEFGDNRTAFPTSFISDLLEVNAHKLFPD